MDVEVLSQVLLLSEAPPADLTSELLLLAMDGHEVSLEAEP